MTSTTRKADIESGAWVWNGEESPPKTRPERRGKHESSKGIQVDLCSTVAIDSRSTSHCHALVTPKRLIPKH